MEENNKNSENPEEIRQEPVASENPVEPEAPEKVSDEKEARIKDLQKQLLRLNADFDNYRKRVEKEKQDKFTLGKEVILTRVIGFIDIFEKALEMSHTSKDKDDVIHGIKLLNKEFMDFLHKEGVKQIDSLHKKLEPMSHEAIGFEYNDKHKDSVIIKEVQKGYVYNNYVLRPAKVIVSKKKEEPAVKEEVKKEETPVPENPVEKDEPENEK
jgi:molecular chaperone GrpE